MKGDQKPIDQLTKTLFLVIWFLVILDEMKWANDINSLIFDSCNIIEGIMYHTTYRRNNMHQKCGGDFGLWVLNEIILKKYPENMKKKLGAVWELPAI